MSRNDQILVKKYKEKYYVFDVMAESWSKTNSLNIKEAKGVFNTREEALSFAHDYDNKDEWGGSEYGVREETLSKDGAKVKIVNPPNLYGKDK